LADHKPFTPKVLAQDRRDHASSKPAAVRKLDHRTTRLPRELARGWARSPRSSANFPHSSTATFR